MDRALYRTGGIPSRRPAGSILEISSDQGAPGACYDGERRTDPGSASRPTDLRSALHRCRWERLLDLVEADRLAAADRGDRVQRASFGPITLVLRSAQDLEWVIGFRCQPRGSGRVGVHKRLQVSPDRCISRERILPTAMIGALVQIRGTKANKGKYHSLIGRVVDLDPDL